MFFKNVLEMCQTVLLQSAIYDFERLKVNVPHIEGQNVEIQVILCNMNIAIDNITKSISYVQAKLGSLTVSINQMYTPRYVLSLAIDPYCSRTAPLNDKSQRK